MNSKIAIYISMRIVIKFHTNNSMVRSKEALRLEGQITKFHIYAVVWWIR